MTAPLSSTREKKMDDKLKPCPFCGGPAYLHEGNRITKSSIVECQSCNAMSGARRDAVENWNRRSPSPDVAVEALEEIWETIDKNPAGATPVGMILQIGTIARAAIASLSSSNVMGVPDGWKLVPIEPTDEMLRAGDDAILDDSTPYITRELYRAMLSASPASPSQPKE